jgi:hypothetical protein
MAKEIKDKPVDTKEEKDLRKLDREIVFKKKAEIVIANKEDSFSYKGIDIALSDVSLVGNKLTLTATATKDGKDLFIDNPLIFINPPLKVPDGTVHVVDGREVDNFVYDPKTALKEIVYQVITAQNKGVVEWQP